MSQAAPRSGITGKSRRPQELSRLAVGDERSELGLYCDEGCGREGDPTLACCLRTRKVRTDHAEECFDGLSALWTSLHEALSVRITTLLNKLINLHGSPRYRAPLRRRLTGHQHRPDLQDLEILSCPHCGFSKRGRESRSIRRWRHIGLWGNEAWLEGEIRRLRCKKCETVVTEAVPCARHDSDFTKSFEDAVALLAQQTSKTAVAVLTGISWATVGNIAERVVAEHLDPDRFCGIKRIAVNEISFRKRHRYLTVVTDHDSRKVIWVAEGKSSEVLKRFFTEIGADACEAIEIATIDMSAAYRKAILEGLPNAKIVFDHFHVAKLANEALSEVRRELVRNAETVQQRKAIKGTMWPLYQ